MNIEEYREYCINKPGVTEEFPFDDKVLVFKVMGKMFALGDVEKYNSDGINLKCEPEKAIQLREEFDGVIEGWHMNKKHWNTVRMDGSIPVELIREMIDHSYELVASGLTRVLKAALKELQSLS